MFVISERTVVDTIEITMLITGLPNFQSYYQINPMQFKSVNKKTHKYMDMPFATPVFPNNSIIVKYRLQNHFKPFLAIYIFVTTFSILMN